MNRYNCTVHPRKTDPWWPTCLSYDKVEAPNVATAKAKAWRLALLAGMAMPRKVVALKVVA